MNDLTVFQNPEFGRVRTLLIDGDPWFVGKDVAVVLGYSNSRDALSKHVDDEDKGVAKCDTPGGIQDLVVINESGLYSLILSSKIPAAKRFKRWVTSEVLPSFRMGGKVTNNMYLQMSEHISRCPESHMPYLLNVLRHVVSDIDNGGVSHSATPGGKQKNLNVGCTKPFNHTKLDKYMVENAISSAQLDAMVGCYSGSAAKWRVGQVVPGKHYRDMICEALGVPEGYFDLRTRRVREGDDGV